MTDRKAIVNDLLALRDLLDDYVQQTDSWDLDTLIEVRDAALVLIDKAKEFDSAMKTEMLRRLESFEGGQTIVGETQYRRKPKRKTHWDHSAVVGLVVDMASRPDGATAEVRTAREAAELAATQMRKLLTSPSTPVKVGELEKLGVDPNEYRAVERNGWELEVVPLGKIKEDDDG